MKYRIGRKQKRALLLVEGSKELAMFNQGQEQLAELVCDLLNKHRENAPVTKYVCDHYYARKSDGTLMPCEFCGYEKDDIQTVL